MKNLRESIRFANKWITNNYRQDRPTNLTYELYILIEKWIYYNIAPRHTTRELRSKAGLISDNISHILGNHMDEVINNDIGLVFVGIGILRKLKIENDHLEKFLRESYQVLKNHIYESKEQALSLAPIKYLLNSLGLKCELFLKSHKL